MSKPGDVWEQRELFYTKTEMNLDLRMGPRYENDPGQNGSLYSWWRCSFGRCVPESERNQKLASGCKRVEKIIG